MLTLIAEKSVPFFRINGRSPHNIGQPPVDDDVSSLAATIGAIGQIKPLAVHGDDLGGYWVLDGGRRWAAQGLRVEAGQLDPEAEAIPVRVYEGDPAELSELSLAASQQRQLHPVEEYEAFATLSAAGHDEARIARDFGLTLRHVRQRLSLGRMAQKIRTAWREGKITREVAQAYCDAGDPGEQEKLYDSMPFAGAWNVRAHARKSSVSSGDPLAIFVGLDAYAKAGGAIRETLFDAEDDKLLTDAALLKKLAREKLQAEGEKIRAEEGWGFVVIGGDPDALRVTYSFADYQNAELRRLDEIEDADDESDNAERREIERKAFLRTIGADVRSRFGVEVEIADDGSLDVTRGLRPAPAAREPEPAAPPVKGKTAEGPAPLEHAKVTPEAPPTKGAAEIATAAATDALQGIAATVGNFALAIFVARAACSYATTAGIEIHSRASFRLDTAKSPLIRQIAHERFFAALKIAAAAPLADLSAAAFEVIAANILPSPLDFKPVGELLAVSSGFGDTRGRLQKALDYEAWFKACPRFDAEDAIRALLGEAEAASAKKLKKGELVAKAAQVAKDKAWLPPLLATALPAEEAPTPDAVMPGLVPPSSYTAGAAKGGLGIHAEPLPPPADDDDRDEMTIWIELFIAHRCDRAEGEKVASSELFAEFAEWHRSRSREELETAGVERDILTVQSFSHNMLELGFEKYKHKTGNYWRGLALKVKETANA